MARVVLASQCDTEAAVVGSSADACPNAGSAAATAIAADQISACHSYKYVQCS